MENVGQQDGEETLSELHDREVKAFETQLAHQHALSAALMSEASKGLAKAKIYNALATLLNIATTIGAVAAVREVVKWW